MSDEFDLEGLRDMAEAGDVRALRWLPTLLDRLKAAEARAEALERSLTEVAQRHGGSTGVAKAALGLPHGNGKLTPAEMEAIRNDGRSLRAIAAAYGVHFSTISKIKGGKHSSDQRRRS